MSPRPASAARRAPTRPAAATPLASRTFDARRDTPDLRDRLYVPTLVEVPSEISLASYRAAGAPVLNQGKEGACTGFGLAAVVHYLLRRRRVVPDKKEVAPRMLYFMARRYDEWPGEAYEGSSARGAMKGWHKHGACSLAVWNKSSKSKSKTLLTTPCAQDALERPLGAYFRVNQTDLVAMHAALAEVGILYATASIHTGWDKIGENGRIPFENDETGGHAFAIVAYDRAGFWIQNSWGADWGRDGFCHISYDDWLKNGTDVWVARLGVPVETSALVAASASTRAGSGSQTALDLALLRPHVIGLGNNGALRQGGVLGNDEAAVKHLFEKGGDFDSTTKDWPVKRLLLYAHGGLNDEAGALQRVQNYRKALLDNQVYPVAFVWKTDYWSTIRNVLEDAKKRRRPEAFGDAAKDFLFNNLDDLLEPVARGATGKLSWDEMKENATLATTGADGGARLAAREIAKLMRRDRNVELHIVGHSAGSIVHAPIVRLLTSDGALKQANGRPFQKDPGGTAPVGEGLTIKTVTMWAPACTVALFRECYEPAIKSGRIGSFALFTLTEAAEENDDCAGIYHKSLLHLVSHSFEKRARIPKLGRGFAGEPILGMEWWIKEEEAFLQLHAAGRVAWIKSPNSEKPSTGGASTAMHHGAFDDDGPTLQSTLARILGPGAGDKAGAAAFKFDRSAQRLAEIRETVMR